MADCIRTTRNPPIRAVSWVALAQDLQVDLPSDQSEQTAGLSEVTIFGSGFA